jgi:predicted NAD/FAD-binding protein
MTTATKSIAVIGSGVTGLGAAWALSSSHQVTLLERDDRLGGHARTIDIPVGDHIVPVDTGFIVFNHRNYPNLTNLFATLGVSTEATDMSFSVQSGSYEFAATAGALLSDPRNLMSRRTWAILRGINRFRKEVGGYATAPNADTTLIEFLRAGNYPEPFISDYLLPLAAAVWSGAGTDAASMPIGTFLHFLANHGLFELERPKWRTVTGGSREYVDRISKEIPVVRTGVEVTSVTRVDGGVIVTTPDGSERYDEVVLATHAPQSIKLLGNDLRADEAEVLGAFRYAPNRAVVHRDPSVMPKRRSAWSAWNAISTAAVSEQPISVTYWMNQLQNLEERHDVFITLNPSTDPVEIIDDIWYAHPQFNPDTDRAQKHLPEIQGRDGVWFCGAWTGYGFHEDGLQSGLTVAAALGSPAPWHDDIVAATPAALHSAPVRGPIVT